MLVENILQTKRCRIKYYLSESKLKNLKKFVNAAL